ncbi:MAG: SCP2 sterol-binding domain-containing protein [Polyangiaceae bacterium]|nr:SCP2 sterol-binding domain-containing protein [Polyangiaceae bacterium]
MSQDPVSFLRTTFPQLFEKGVALLQKRADGGDATAKQLLDNAVGGEGGGVVQIADHGEVYFAAKDGKVTTSDRPISGAAIKFAARIPGDAASLVLGEAAKEGALENEKAAIAITQTVNREIEEALAGREMTFHLTIAETPDLGDVTVWVGFNVEAPPETPKFTVTIKYDDYEDLREKKGNLQQAFMQGKLRMTGDYSVALQIAMQLAAKAQERARKMA